MDRELSDKIKKQQLSKRIYVSAGIIVGIVILIWFVKSILTPTLNHQRIRTFKAEIGNVENTINASGVVVPEFEQIIISPIQTQILAVNVQAGENIRIGQSIIELYTGKVKNEYEKVTDEYELKKNKINKLKLDISNELSELRTQYDVKSIRVKYLNSSLKLEKKLYDIGAATNVSVEEAELALKIEERELELLEKKISNKEKAFAAELHELELEVKIQNRIKDELKSKLEDSYVKAKTEGIVTFVKDEIGSSVSEGDILAKIADLNSFKIEASISDIYADRLFHDGRVRIRINNKDILGRIKSISPTVNDGIVNFYITPDEKSHPLLRANLRVEVFVITSNSENVVRVKNGPFFSASANQKIYIVKDNTAVRIDAEFGASNFDFVEIRKGIEPGDIVIISDMTDYYHMKEVEIN